MKKILIIGAGELQVAGIKQAKEMGLYVVTVDMNPDSPGFQFADESKVISTNDIPAVVDYAKEVQVDAVITCADMPVRTVAAVAKELNLHAISVENSFKATNKILMREALKKHGVPIPYFYKAANEEEFFKAVQEVSELGYKCIVKPADNSGSRGVSLIDRYDVEYLREIYEYSKSSSRCGEVIVEEFMEGPEVCVETLSYEGECYPIQITDKITTGAPYFVEMGHSQPSQHPIDVQEKIRKVAIEANMAIGNYNGSSCTEVKITKDGVKVVELGARLAGDYMTSDLVPLSTGVNMEESIIKIALGEKPDFEHKFERASAILFIEAKEGIVRGISGVDEAKNIPGIVKVGINCKVGDKSVIIRSSLDRLGYVIAQGDSPAEALQTCKKGIEKIKIIV